MAKNTCFVDSVGWIPLQNADNHQEVDTVYKQLMKSGFRFVTTTAVLNEVGNSLCKPKFRGAVVEYHKRFQKSHRVEIVFVDENLWSSGWEFYENRSDKEWSLTDCISIVIMQEQSLGDKMEVRRVSRREVPRLFTLVGAHYVKRKDPF